MHKHIYQNNHEIRPISDIDILIKKENLIEVLKVSEDLGFDIAKWKTIKKEGLEIYRNPNPFHKNGLAQLDIHTTATGFDFALDSNDNVHISWYGLSEYDLMYTTDSSGEWSTVSVDAADRRGGANSIEVDSVDNIHILYT